MMIDTKLDNEGSQDDDFSTKEAACKTWSKYYDNTIIHRPLSSSYSSVFIRMQQGG